MLGSGGSRQGPGIRKQARAITKHQQLESSLKDIGDIVGTLQRIAQQTSLIALNAAVEAALAGEAGRGFSVIAGEILSLSKRTSEATGDVTRIQHGLQDNKRHLATA